MEVGILPVASLRDAAKAMRAAGSSCLPVVRGGVVIGLIREHDLVKAMAMSRRPEELAVAHFMSVCVMASEADEIPEALAKMLAVACVDIPVVDRGHLAGMVSARELLAAQAHIEGIAV